jgi:hypothetical protein
MRARRRWTRPAARWRWRTFAGVLASIVVWSTAACAGGPGASQAPVPEVPSEASTPAGEVSEVSEMSAMSRYLLGLSHIRRHEFDEGARELAELAERCESGFWGRDAVLVLASLELDPRNVDGSPSSAARLAARYLQIPGAPAAAVAETLYLLAVDLGGEPVSDPLAQSPEAAGTSFAFDDCDLPREPVLVRELPLHPDSPSTRTTLLQAAAQRDALAAVVDSLALRTAELEAEIDRIRRLLAPDTVRGGGGAPLPRRP